MSDSRYLTLAGCAGDDSIWAELEAGWNQILHTNVPRAEYFHMSEAFGLRRQFEGWSNRGVDSLRSKLLSYLSNVDKKRFKMFSCTVDLDAWNRVQRSIPALPASTQLCITYCVEQVLGWYGTEYPGLLDGAEFSFDRDEDIEAPFKSRWNEELAAAEATGASTPWSFIQQVGLVEMRKQPGIQAADIFAWACNQRIKGDEKDFGLFHLLRKVIPMKPIFLAEKELRERYGVRPH